MRKQLEMTGACAHQNETEKMTGQTRDEFFCKKVGKENQIWGSPGNETRGGQDSAPGLPQDPQEVSNCSVSS